MPDSARDSRRRREGDGTSLRTGAQRAAARDRLRRLVETVSRPGRITTDVGRLALAVGATRPDSPASLSHVPSRADRHGLGPGGGVAGAVGFSAIGVEYPLVGVLRLPPA